MYWKAVNAGSNAGHVSLMLVKGGAIIGIYSLTALPMRFDIFLLLPFSLVIPR